MILFLPFISISNLNKLKVQLFNVSLEITSLCNLNCKYCYNHWKAAEDDYYSNSYKKAIKTLKQLFKVAHVDTITFTGGEPFISQRFEEVVLYARLQNKKVNIITNGNSSTHDQLKRLIKMGVQLFELPFHSSQPNIHDLMTTVGGSWQKSYDSILAITQNGGYVVPVIVITKYNYKEIEETIEFLHNLGLDRIMVNRFNIGGNGIKAKDELHISAKDLKDTFAKIDSLAVKYNLTISSNVCTPFCLLNPSDYPNIEFGSCPTNVIYRPLTVDIEGNLRLCNHSPVVAGNIFTTEMREILNSEYVAKWTDIRPTYCSNCDKFEVCLGGCRAASEQMNLTLADVDPVLQTEKRMDY